MATDDGYGQHDHMRDRRRRRVGAVSTPGQPDGRPSQGRRTPPSGPCRSNAGASIGIGTGVGTGTSIGTGIGIGVGIGTRTGVRAGIGGVLVSAEIGRFRHAPGCAHGRRSRDGEAGGTADASERDALRRLSLGRSPGGHHTDIYRCRECAAKGPLD